MHNKVRNWICEVLNSRQALINLALTQRAKFEGWLKFELADKAAHNNAQNITIEAILPSSKFKSDLAFTFDSIRYFLELKTPNTNWRIPGILSLTRPITMNFESIIEDGKKLQNAGVNGILAFTVFPVPIGDERWINYYERVATSLLISTDIHDHAEKVYITRNLDNRVEIIVISMPILPRNSSMDFSEP